VRTILACALLMTVTVIGAQFLDDIIARQITAQFDALSSVIKEAGRGR
jgi:hypothetical protein